jgi:toxin ParE1/3/4
LNLRKDNIKHIFNLTLRGKIDLHSIWDYTFDTWGEAQADKYITKLYSRFSWLADNPEIGKHRVDIKEGYYCYLQDSHLIFYTIDQGNINIIGVPHKAMDILNYFTT